MFLRIETIIDPLSAAADHATQKSHTTTYDVLIVHIGYVETYMYIYIHAPTRKHIGA